MDGWMDGYDTRHCRSFVRRPFCVLAVSCTYMIFFFNYTYIHILRTLNFVL